MPPALKVTVSSAVHPSNAPMPMEVTFLPMAMLVSSVQPLNTSLGMVVKLSGRVIEVILEPAKAPGRMAVTDSGMT